MSTNIDELIGALEAALPGAVSVDEGVREEHSVDCWPVALKRQQRGNVPAVPAVVVSPRNVDETIAVVRIAAEHEVPVTPWGAGSSVVGQPLPQHNGISLDTRSLVGDPEVDEDNLTVRVGVGMMGSDLEAALGQRGYTTNFSPQSIERSTVGGWVATRATGQFSSKWGGIEHALVALTAVLPDGSLFSTRSVPRASTGPDLNQLFVGSEGTFAVVTEVVLKIYPVAQQRLLETVRFAELNDGVDAMRTIMRHGLRPFVLRLYDQDEARHALRQPEFNGSALMLGCDGLPGVAAAELAEATSLCVQAGGDLIGDEGTAGWMERRFDFSAVERLLAEPTGYAETIEVANSWTGIRHTYEQMKERLGPLADEVLGHFSHAYTNGTSLYVILLGRAASSLEAETTLGQIWETAMEVCLETGAALSHHHGVGQARLPWLDRDLSGSIDLLRRIKGCLDPATTLAPGALNASTVAARA